MRLKRIVTVLLTMLAAALLLGVAAPSASAHAALLRTTPGDAEILAAGPPEVTLTFGEPVGIGLGNLKVLSAEGDRVDEGAVTRNRNVVHIPLKPDLQDGTYVVVWRVVSEDSHPVSGAFTFSVGAPSVDSSKLLGRGNLTSITEAPRAPGIALGVSRFAGFAALVVLLGGSIFCLVIRAAALPIRLLAIAAGVEALAAAAALLLQGPYASGRALSEVSSGSLLKEVLHSQYGGATACRIGLSFLALALLLFFRKPILLVVVGVGIAATWSLAGHAGVGTWQPWTFASDVTHLITVSAWVGGLTLIVRGLRNRWTLAEQAAILPRWSKLATWSVVALIATGTFAGIREVGELDALFSTRYGALLLAKDGLVGLMLLFALIGRSHVRQHYTHRADDASDEPTEEDVAGLRRSTSIETGLAVVVLVVTALLVNTTPAKAAFAPPYSGRSVAGPLTVQVDIYPARKGLNGLHIYTVGAGGRTVDVEEVTGEIAREGDELTIHAKHKSLGHYEDLHLVLPEKGHWTITLQVRTSDTDSYETKQELDVK
jgi:copper transport protein